MSAIIISTKTRDVHCSIPLRRRAAVVCQVGLRRRSVLDVLVHVSSHDVGYWANSFLQDLERTCKDHNRRRSWGIGFGLGFRVVALDPNFRKLSMEHIVSAYRRTRTRAILLDYDGTLMPQASIKKSPCPKSIEILNSLCHDKRNIVFLVSARSRSTLSEWFSPCENLGLAAEHGYFLRYLVINILLMLRP